MIAFLRGIIIETKNNRVVIDVNGMGYRVFCLPSFVLSVAEKKDKEILLHTYQYIRENVVELYGFETTREEQMFEILIAISGIGPKGAMSILAAAPLDVLQRAIVSEDTSILTRISGIGNKTAHKIVVELQDKFGEEWGALPGDITEETDVLDALTQLGYSRPEAQKSLSQIPRELKGVEEKIKAALRILGK